MADITIKIDGARELAAAFKKAPAIAAREFQVAIEKSIKTIQGDAMKEAPVNKQSGGGNLRQSIKAGMRSRGVGVIEVQVNYGAYVHEGTGPSTGRYVPAIGKRIKSGTHPGQKANPFLKRSVDKNRGYVNKQFSKAVENTFRKIK